VQLHVVFAFILTSIPKVAVAGTSVQRVEVAAAPVFVPAPILRPLFDSREWVFRVETTLEYFDLDDPRAKDGVVSETRTDSATCRAIRVVRWANSIGSRIACSGPLSSARVEGRIPVAGTFVEGDWVATARGLWHPDAPVVDGPEPAVAPGDIVIAAHPGAGEKVTSNGKESTMVWRHGRTWCATHALSGGDHSSDTLCFAPSTGLLAGSREFAGGEYHEIRFCSGPAACRMLSNPPSPTDDASRRR
jgi:hypothetical protein